METLEKTLLMRAIDDYGIYTVAQRTVLKTLVGLSVGDIANVSCAYLMEVANLTRASIYLNLKKFQNDGFITRVKKTGSKQDIYKLEFKNLNTILQLYQNKQAMKNM